MMRALEEQLGELAGDPGALLTEINRALRGSLRQSGATLFTTACYLIADFASSRITFANAAHPSPLLVRGTPREVEPISARNTAGPALGIFEDVQYRTHESHMAEDDLILFFTDGLFEVENARDESFGESRLRESFRRRAGMPPVQLMHDVFAEIQRFAKGRGFSDDVCLIGMEIAHLESCAELVRH